MLSSLKLLPSQNAVLKRITLLDLQKNTSLKLISGDAGAGKSTILSNLASKSHISRAWLSSAKKWSTSSKKTNINEIRRQILVQLTPRSLSFDDEVSLFETIKELQSELLFPLRILIDDAQYLPMKIWQECLQLTQFKLSTDNPNVEQFTTINTALIQLVFTVESSFYIKLQNQFKPSLWRLIRTMQIPALSLKEQQTIYDNVFHQTNDVTLNYDSNRKINKAKRKQNKDALNDVFLLQSGTPKEVIALFEESISTPSLDNDNTNHAKNAHIPSKILFFVSTFFITFFSFPVNAF